MTKLQT